jgi:hypothetical protein
LILLLFLALPEKQWLFLQTSLKIFITTARKTIKQRQQAAGSRQQAAGSRQQAAGSRQQAAGRARLKPIATSFAWPAPVLHPLWLLVAGRKNRAKILLLI